MASELPPPRERYWWYEVDVGTLMGAVRAADEDAAMLAAGEDAHERAPEAIDEGTWYLRELEGGEVENDAD